MLSTLPLFFLLLTSAKGFDESLIAGRYTLSQGSCSSPLALSLNSTKLPPNTIFLNNTPCARPSVTLTSTPVNKTSLHTFLSEAPQIESFLTTPQNITCGNSTIQSITLLSPNQQLTLPSTFTPSQVGVTLNNDFIYLLTKNCIFTRKKPDDDDLVQQILNTVTECLPADALISTSTGLKRADKLSNHALIHTTSGIQPILTWTHRDPSILTTFLKIEFEATQSGVELTPGHYVFADGILQQAKMVRPGMLMQSQFGDLVVSRVESVVKRGVYNPHTPAGDLFVGQHKVKISCYTSAVEPIVAHALFTPIRGVYEMNFGWMAGVGRAVEVLVESLRSTGVVAFLSGY